MKSINVKIIIGATVIGAALICGCGQSHGNKSPVQTKWDNASTKLSPFTRVRYDGEKVMVTYNGSEYELAAINGLPTADILGFCKSQYPNQWQRRFAEDLVPVLNDMGHPINADSTVSLTLIESQTGQQTDIANASMTEENRSAVHKAFEAGLSAGTNALKK